MASFKNWPAIMALDDPFLQTCLIGTSDPETLRIIECGAPHLFSSLPVQPHKVPLSFLRLREKELEGSEDGAIVHTFIYYDYPYEIIVPMGEALYSSDIQLTDEGIRGLPWPLRLGQVIQFMGGDWVVLHDMNLEMLEAYREFFRLCIAPFECIDPDA